VVGREPERRGAHRSPGSGVCDPGGRIGDGVRWQVVGICPDEFGALARLGVADRASPLVGGEEQSHSVGAGFGGAVHDVREPQIGRVDGDADLFVRFTDDTIDGRLPCLKVAGRQVELTVAVYLDRELGCQARSPRTSRMILGVCG
jgi:hypothetical protein